MTTTVYQGQNLLDKSLETSGGLVNLLELAILNNISVTDDLTIGNEIIVNKNIKNLENRRIATAITLQQIEQTPIIGIGTMIIGNNFIVAP